MINNKQKGFTLLETIVALVIASASLLILIQSFTGGFRAKSTIEKRLVLARTAKNLMSDFDIKNTPISTTSKGILDNGISWTITTAPMTNNTNENHQAKWVTVIVEDPASPSFFKLKALKTILISENTR